MEPYHVFRAFLIATSASTMWRRLCFIVMKNKKLFITQGTLIQTIIFIVCLPESKANMKVTFMRTMKLQFLPPFLLTDPKFPLPTLSCKIIHKDEENGCPWRCWGCPPPAVCCWIQLFLSMLILFDANYLYRVISWKITTPVRNLMLMFACAEQLMFLGLQYYFSLRTSYFTVL